MTDDDLIRRGDALALPPYDGDGDPAGQWDHHIFVRREAIAALPAVSAPVAVRVKPLEWFEVERGSNGYGKWTAEGYTVRKIEGLFLLDFAGDGKNTWRFITSEAAKAAAQADYERRILAALAPASGGVEATEDVGILRARVDELQRLNADLTRQVQMQPRRPQDAAPATDAVDALVDARERIAALEMPDTTSELANQRALAIIDAIREGRK